MTQPTVNPDRCDPARSDEAFFARDEHDEFGLKLLDQVEAGLIRMEYYGDGIIPLIVDLDFTKEQKETDVDPGYPESATVVSVWHKGVDIYALVAPGIIEEMEIQCVESGYGGDADEGDDWGDRERDRQLEEAADRADREAE